MKVNRFQFTGTPERKVKPVYLHYPSSKPVSIYRYAGKESVIKECEKSLKRLRTDYIDLLQIHWSDPTTPIKETMEAMEILMKAAKIRAAGVCNYNLEDIKAAEDL